MCAKITYNPHQTFHFILINILPPQDGGWLILHGNILSNLNFSQVAYETCEADRIFAFSALKEFEKFSGWIDIAPVVQK